MKKMFTKEHIGQPVYSEQFGAGTIFRVDEDANYPVRVMYGTIHNVISYTQDGRYTADSAPVLVFGTGHSYGEPLPPRVYTRRGKVSITPMTRGAYNACIGCELPEGENGEDEGYLVRCLVNQEFVNWQPAEQFHNTHVQTIV